MEYIQLNKTILTTSLIAVLAVGNSANSEDFKSCSCLPTPHPQSVLEQKPTLNVTGTGYVDKEPDVAYLKFTAFAEHENPSQAASQVNQQVQLLESFLKQEENKKTHLTLGSVSVRSKFRTVCEKHILTLNSCKAKIVGFEALRNITVKVEDFSLIWKITEFAFNKAQISKIDGITYDILNKSSARAEAGELAVKDAQNKALGLANGLNLELGRPENISFKEISSDMPRMLPLVETKELRASKILEENDNTPTTPTYKPDTVRVSSTVYVTYPLKEK